MKASVVKTALVYLMLIRSAPPAAAEIVTGVSLVGGSGPHEGTIRVAVSDDCGQSPSFEGHVTALYYWEARAICRTLGFPGVHRAFSTSPYSAYHNGEPGFHLRCSDESTLTTVIGCRAYVRHGHFQQIGVKCQNDTRYLGCFRDTQDARPLATSPCPPGPNSDYSCIDRDNMTTESCLGYCRMLNDSDVIITYAGVRAGSECTCGVSTTELGYQSDSSDKDCDTPCSGDSVYSNCGGPFHTAAFSITSKPEEQETITPAMPAGPDGDSCFCGPADTAARNAEMGAGVVAVMFAVLTILVNVFVYARARKQSAKSNMVSMTKLTTTSTAATSTTSDKHEVYQPLTNRPTSGCYTGLEVPSQTQDDSYETPISPGEEHSRGSTPGSRWWHWR